MSSPLITIMIPTYNQSAYIREAIDSALAQTYKNIEILVGDDASTDNTEEIVRSIQDPRLKYIKNPINLGRIGNYRNLLFNNASGKFVINLDGDDYYTDKDFILNAIKLIQEDPSIVMVCARATTKDSTILGGSEYVSMVPCEPKLTGREILKKLPNKKYFMKHMATLYSKNKAIEIDFYRSEGLSSDWESLFRLSLRGKVAYLDRNVGAWRIHNSNESKTTDAKKLLSNLSVWPAIYSDAKIFGMNYLLAELQSTRCLAYFSQTILVNESLKGNKKFISALSFIVSNYRSVAIPLIANPIYLARIILCLTGYYRRNTTGDTIRKTSPAADKC